MSGHTPGPWKVALHGRAAYVSIYHPLGLPRETGWAEFSIQPYSQPAQAEANARLIAAAPDLLAALKIVCEASQLAVSALDSDDPGADSMMAKFWRSLEPARTAIAKAEGRT